MVLGGVDPGCAGGTGKRLAEAWQASKSVLASTDRRGVRTAFPPRRRASLHTGLSGKKRKEKKKTTFSDSQLADIDGYLLFPALAGWLDRLTALLFTYLLDRREPRRHPLGPRVPPSNHVTSYGL